MKFRLLLALFLLADVARADVIATGTVLDADGKPVAGAHLRGWRTNENRSWFDVQTDDKGAFVLEGRALPAKGWQAKIAARVAVIAPGHALGGGPLKSGANTIRLAKPRTLSGRIVDETGKPVEGVEVRLIAVFRDRSLDQSIENSVDVFFEGRMGEGFSTSTKTDAAGKWTLNGLPPKGAARVRIDDARFASASADAPLSENAAAPDIILSPGATLTGRVVDENGKPLAGVKVYAGASNYAPTSIGGSATSGADGAFALTGLSDGAFDVTTYPEVSVGRVGKTSQAQAVAGKSVPIGDLVLTQGAIIEGTIVDAQSGAIIEGAILGTSNNGGCLATAPELDGAKGRFSLRVAPGENMIYLRGAPGGYLSRTDAQATNNFQFKFVLREGETKIVTFKLPRALALQGRAVDENGNALAGVNINVSTPGLTSGEATSDDKGALSWEGLAPGEATLEAKGAWEIVAPVKVTLPAAAPLVVTLRKIAQQTLRGRVVDTQGQPVAGAKARVTVWKHYDDPLVENWGGGEMNEMEQDLESDADGRFESAPFRAGRRVQLQVSKPDFRLVRGGEISQPHKEMLGVNGAMVPNPNAPFVASDAVFAALDQVARGRVVGEENQPVEGARVFSPQSEKQAVSDNEGRFALDGLPAGDSEIMASKEWLFGKARLKTGVLSDIALHPLAEQKPDIARAKAILEEVVDGTNADFRQRLYIAPILIPYDVEGGLALAEKAQNGNISDQALGILVWTLAQSDDPEVRERAAEVAARLSPDADPFLAAVIAANLADTAPDQARALYERIAARFADKVSPALDAEPFARFTFLAGLAAKLKLPGAAQQADDVIAAAIVRAGDKNDGFLESTAGILAAGGAATFERALNAIPPDRRAGALSQAVPELAKTDLASARRLLDQIPLQPKRELGHSYWMYSDPQTAFGEAALAVIKELGKTDAAAALALARRVESPEFRARALVRATLAQPKNEKLKLLREAFDLPAGRRTEGFTQAHIAALAWDIEPKVGRELFDRLLSGGAARAKQGNVWLAGGEAIGDELAPDIAFYLARFDPGRSRALLESAWAHRINLVNEDNGAIFLSGVANAMVAVDTERALEMARLIPQGVRRGEDTRWEIFLQAARWLLMPIEERRNYAMPG